MEQQQPQPQTKKISRTTPILIIIVVILAIGVGVYFYFMQSEEEGNVNVVKNVNTAANTNTVSNSNTNQVSQGDEKICDLGMEYEHTAVSPISCECPEGYIFEVVTMGWGPCPEEGMSDCQASVLKCVVGYKFDTTSWQTYEDQVSGYSVQYPSDYLIKMETDGYVVFDTTFIDSPSLTSYYFNVAAEDNDYHTYRLGLLTDPSVDNESPIEEGDMAIGGLDGMKISFKNALGETVLHYVVSYLGKVYDLSAKDSIDKDVLGGALSRFQINQLAADVDIADTTYFSGRECVGNNDCGAFPCVDSECLVKECGSDSDCSKGTCGQYVTPVPGYCTMIDVL